ncbi:ferrochelatase [Vibrio cholerae]|nr:ferrochelatase [Vibrio cholerae]ORP23480.1 ferrochelatase [Vibrio paracholerae]MBW5432503.1 ferrochelatase [Vibrio cholerae]MEB5598019.1 ferrochelatase [Vibrio cholerae]NAO20676.1 ferrochelatase [Vibrio cholerae]
MKEAMNNHKKLGILLANLGTPQAPTSQAVKAFLSQFLHDQRVVDMSRWLWCPLLHGIILPTRSPKVAKLYQSIWMDEGSPLMVYSRRQRDKLAELSQRPVELGMTYGEPSLLDGVRKLQQQGVEQIVVLPLYPQYSATTTAAVFDGIAKALRQLPVVPELHFIRDYHDHPLYIQALAKSVRASWQLHGQGDLLLCSYHGIPKRYAQNGDIYPEHCKKTTELLAQALGLPQDKVMMTYQSQFGKEEWLQPYTDKTMEALPRQGIKKLDVICPAFSVDCLETLEEIAEQNQEIFLHSGGEAFHYIPCLNDSQSHIELMAALVKVDC